MDAKELAHGVSGYTIPPRLGLGKSKSTLLDNFSPEVSKAPQPILGASTIKLLLVFQVCMFFVAWFGLSVCPGATSIRSVFRVS